MVNDDSRLEEADIELLRRVGDEVIVRGRGLRNRLIVAERTPLLGIGIKVRPISSDQDDVAEPEAPRMVALSDEERERLIAMVEANSFMPATAKERVVRQLRQPEVPAAMLDRLRSRAGG